MAKTTQLLGRVTSIVVIVVVAFAVVGYVLASVARASIEQEERQQAVASGKTGLDFGGQTVPASQFKVGSRVKWPFVVEGYYAVPFDLHASIHATTYLVMPWGKYVLSMQVVYPL